MEPQLVEKIVHEVKSQGVFDEFRKDCMADVDTKPAYQNLRQRVEGSVKKFLNEQKWTPDMNKNQIRERLRRHITGAGFLDVGVERIVDQVVNPKIGSVFQPRIEEIAYKYLGIRMPPPHMKCEPPPPPLMHQFPPLPLGAPPALKIETPIASLLPTDLEQVSPDSDKATVKSELKDETQDMEIDERIDDDDESPPFEPLVRCASPPIKQEFAANDDINNMNWQAKNNTQHTLVDAETQDTSTRMSLITAEVASHSMDAIASQESQLSQVSSNSRLSSVSPDFTESTEAAAHRKSQALENAAVNISEEAQMPKFNENSSEGSGNQNPSQLHFDIKKDEIKFEGTERKGNMPPISNESNYSSERSECVDTKPKLTDDGIKIKLEEDVECKKEMDDTLQLSKLNEQPETTAAITSTTVTSHDSSFGSSLEDTTSSLHLGSAAADKNKIETNPTTYAEQKTLAAISDKPQNIAQPITPPLQPRDKHEVTSTRHTSMSSSSSSRHKKHSKEKYRSHERSKSSQYKDRERERSKSRERSRDRNSRSKYSSNSSKKSSSSSSTKRNSDVNSKNETKKSTSTKNVTSSSSCSSSRGSENYTDKGSKVEQSNKKNERKSVGTSSANDDHNEAKNRIQRHRSTDDDDEDKSGGTVAPPPPPPPPTVQRSTSATTSSSSRNTTTNNKNSTKSHSSDSKSKQNAEQCQSVEKDDCDGEEGDSPKASKQLPQTHHNKVVILNDILQNPTTDFIELETRAHINHVQVVVTKTTTMETPELSVEYDENDNLLYFEEINKQIFTARLKQLDHAMDTYRRMVSNLRSTSTTPEETKANRNLVGDTIESSEEIATFNDSAAGSKQTQATLLIDCIEYRKRGGSSSSDAEELNQIDDEAIYAICPRKRFKYNKINETVLKTSPTPSDSSVNSKENEILDKNKVNSKNAATHRNGNGIKKLNQQQRYSSEDLYKPRPVLSQRSKRRGFDTVIHLNNV